MPYLDDGSCGFLMVFGSEFIIRQSHSVVFLDSDGFYATNPVTFSHSPGIGAAKSWLLIKTKDNAYILYVYMFYWKSL